MIEPAYTYRAVIASVYDGDTLRADVDLGFYTWLKNQNFRLYGIDAPEIRGTERPNGLVTRDWLRDKLPVGTKVIIETIKDARGKYGRWLCTVYLDGVNLNLMMIEEGLAEPYVG